jgi:hypothetical protein
MNSDSCGFSWSHQCSCVSSHTETRRNDKVTANCVHSGRLIVGIMRAKNSVLTPSEVILEKHGNISMTRLRRHEVGRPLRGGSYSTGGADVKMQSCLAVVVPNTPRMAAAAASLIILDLCYFSRTKNPLCADEKNEERRGLFYSRRLHRHKKLRRFSGKLTMNFTTIVGGSIL